MNAKHIATIIAILDNAIANLWDGSNNLHYDPKTGTNNTYMCHAVEFAISEIVLGDRQLAVAIGDNEEYGVELHEKIMAAIPGTRIASSYCRNTLGLFEDTEIQAFRKKTLETIRAEYAEKLAKIVKPSALASYAAAYNFRGNDGQPGFDGHYRSMFTCIAVEYAADEFKDQGRDATEAVSVVKAKIAECLGVTLIELGSSTLEVVLIRMFGETFVDTQGFEWRQARRMDMMQRIAQQLKKEGN